MEVSEGILQKALNNRFKQECCSLSNVYAYGNESDFLSIDYNGIATEIEIKISRSDFKADFKKLKHKSYGQFIKGRTHVVECWDTRFLSCDIGSKYREISPNHSRLELYYSKNPNYIFIDGKHFIVNETEEYTKRHYRDQYPVSCIHFIPIHLPNRFYYLVPEGLIEKHEVPSYAGLMYYHGVSKDPMKRISIVKNATKIHKDKFNRWESVARRLYNISKYSHVQNQLTL